jgi:recombinational DNA repair ATPase RecF
LPNQSFHFPFHATQSEQRILRDLIAVAAVRQKAVADADFAKALISRLGPVTDAAHAIAALQQQLFPLETQLRQRRAELLQPLQTRASRTHFDQTLETAEIGMTVKIRNAEDFAALKAAIVKFDFAAWQHHCESERSDAD